MPGCRIEGLEGIAAMDDLDLHALGVAQPHHTDDAIEVAFVDGQPAVTGRPGYHPGLMLRIYLYGYLNQIQSSRRLERECGRNLELIWLTGRLKPDFKTIADFRKDNGPAIRRVCAQFITLCRQLGLLAKASVAIDGSRPTAETIVWSEW